MYHSAPSGPAVIPKGWLLAVGVGKVLTACACASVAPVPVANRTLTDSSKR